MFVVTKDTIISDIVENAPNLVPLFEEIGMYCVGCALASSENIEEACTAHGVNADEFVSRLNATLSGLVQ